MNFSFLDASFNNVFSGHGNNLGHNIIDGSSGDHCGHLSDNVFGGHDLHDVNGNLVLQTHDDGMGGHTIHDHTHQIIGSSHHDISGGEIVHDDLGNLMCHAQLNSAGSHDIYDAHNSLVGHIQFTDCDGNWGNYGIHLPDPIMSLGEIQLPDFSNFI